MSSTSGNNGLGAHVIGGPEPLVLKGIVVGPWVQLSMVFNECIGPSLHSKHTHDLILETYI